MNHPPPIITMYSFIASFPGRQFFEGNSVWLLVVEIHGRSIVVVSTTTKKIKDTYNITYHHQFSKSSPKFEPFVYWYVVLLKPFNISTNYSVDGWCEPNFCRLVIYRRSDLGGHTVDGSEILHHLGCMKPCQ